MYTSSTAGVPLKPGRERHWLQTTKTTKRLVRRRVLSDFDRSMAVTLSTLSKRENPFLWINKHRLKGEEVVEMEIVFKKLNVSHNGLEHFLPWSLFTSRRMNVWWSKRRADRRSR